MSWVSQTAKARDFATSLVHDRYDVSRLWLPSQAGRSTFVPGISASGVSENRKEDQQE
jgi:hypothetical protein